MKRPEKREYVIRTGGEGGELHGVRVHGYIDREIDAYLDHLEDKLEAVITYLNELEDTGNFVDKQKIMNILEGKA